MSFSGDTDSHNHGKKAIMLEAGGVKIIYKPHSLANDIFFSKLFEELSPKLTYDLRTMRSDDMGKEEVLLPLRRDNGNSLFTGNGRPP